LVLPIGQDIIRIGNNIDSILPFTISIGKGTFASYGSCSIGILSSASGSLSSSYGRLSSASGDSSSAYGDSSSASGNSASAYGTGASASGLFSSATGVNSSASELASSAYGANASASGDSSSAYGDFSSASGNSASAYGTGASASGSFSSATGVNSSASELASSAYGINSSASGVNSSAYGYGSSASGVNSSAYGYGSSVSGDDSTSIGYNANVTSNRTMLLGGSNLNKLESYRNLDNISDKRDKIDIKNGDYELNNAIFKDINIVEYKMNIRDQYYDYEDNPELISLVELLKKENQEKENEIKLLGSKEYLYDKGINEEDSNTIKQKLRNEITNTNIKINEIKRGVDKNGNISITDKDGYTNGHKKGTRKHLGVIAQDLQEVIKKHTGGDGYMALIGDPVFENPESVNAKMTVSYTGLIPITIQMVQELMKENEVLKQTNEDLTKRLEIIESKVLNL
jgi:hypothetical protein